MDSANTERASSEPMSRATVASRCRRRTARSRTAQSTQGATAEKSSRILEFAMHTLTMSCHDDELNVHDEATSSDDFPGLMSDLAGIPWRPNSSSGI
jgi:hypothetical protein